MLNIRQQIINICQKILHVMQPPIVNIDDRLSTNDVLNKIQNNSNCSDSVILYSKNLPTTLYITEYRGPERPWGDDPSSIPLVKGHGIYVDLNGRLIKLSLLDSVPFFMDKHN